MLTLIGRPNPAALSLVTKTSPAPCVDPCVVLAYMLSCSLGRGQIQVFWVGLGLMHEITIWMVLAGSLRILACGSFIFAWEISQGI